MAFKPGKTYVLTMTGSSLSQALGSSSAGQVEISAVGGTLYVKFDDNTAAASSTVTSQALPDGNFVVLAGQSKLYELADGQTHVAMIGTAGVIGYATVGYGVKI